MRPLPCQFGSWGLNCRAWNQSGESSPPDGTAKRPNISAFDIPRHIQLVRSRCGNARDKSVPETNVIVVPISTYQGQAI